METVVPRLPVAPTSAGIMCKRTGLPARGARHGRRLRWKTRGRPQGAASSPPAHPRAAPAAWGLGLGARVEGRRGARTSWLLLHAPLGPVRVGARARWLAIPLGAGSVAHVAKDAYGAHAGDSALEKA